MNNRCSIPYYLRCPNGITGFVILIESLCENTNILFLIKLILFLFFTLTTFITSFNHKSKVCSYLKQCGRSLYTKRLKEYLMQSRGGKIRWASEVEGATLYREVSAGNLG